MKKFFEEFKKFISRGNVLDMSVGVIVGGAFTGIVNGMSNFVLKPIINFLLALIFGANSLDQVLTYLKKVEITNPETGVKSIDLANSIYIDWGSFINAIINFLLIAIVLFSIIRIMNRLKERNNQLAETIKEKTLDRKERKELKEAGVCIKDKQAVKKYFEDKKLLEQAKALEQAKLAEEKAVADRLANPTTEDLLKAIKELLEKNITK